jgi:amidohydrolase
MTLCGALRHGNLLAEAERMGPELVSFRRELHRYPELSLQETKTAAQIVRRLNGLEKMEVRTGVGGHGVLADLKGAGTGPIIALRADMDALPIQEESGLPYASERPGIMHACGHDAHTAILLGAALLLHKRRDRLAGGVRFLFQPAEEINAGARAMIEDGVLNSVEEIYGLHNQPVLPAGQISAVSGPMMGSVDRIEIELEGKGGHGAIPDLAIDSIVAASAIVMGLQTAVSREMSPFDPVVVTIGSIHGGEANNVIPHRVTMTGTVRTFRQEVQESMFNRLERIVAGIAEAHRCRIRFTYTAQTPVLVNHDECVRIAERAADALIGPENRVSVSPTLAGEDFALYLLHRPGCFFWLGSGPKRDTERAFGLHHPRFELNEACIPLGSALLAAIVLDRIGT